MGQGMPCGEAEMKGEPWWISQRAPGLEDMCLSWTIHQQAGSLKLPTAGEINNGRIHALRQTKFIGMEKRWISLFVLAGLSTKASRSAPDQGIQQRGCEHQRQGRGLEQR